MRRARGILALAALLLADCGREPARTRFFLGWSTYVGNMPWAYARDSGVLGRWAAAYDIEIEMVHSDYMGAVEAMIAGEVDAVPMTNLECLNMPAAAGVDSTVIILHDYSNGNDAILARGLRLDELPGHTAHLVAGSVSQYLLVRALELQDFFQNEVEVIDVPDAEIAPGFLADPEQRLVATWNPTLMQIQRADPAAELIFSSANVPGEVLDVMVARSDVLAAHPEFGEALAGAWYEVMGLMAAEGPRSEAVVAAMAALSGDSLEDFRVQLAGAAFFFDPGDAVDHFWSTGLQDKMTFIVDFCLDNGFFGQGANWSDTVGIRYPDGTVRGNAQNVKMRFDDTYMRKAANGELALDWRADG